MASLVLANGKIITVDDQFSVHQAVAVDGERIVAVAQDAAVKALIAHTRGNAIRSTMTV